MKKLLFSTALLLSFCYLLAQTSNSQSPVKEILSLQKSNASLKMQLKEQKITLLKQTQKTDSIFSMLQAANVEIKKGVESQNAINQSIASLKEQTANINQVLSVRKTYSIIAFIGFIIIVMILYFYMERKSAVINKSIKKNEEKFEMQLSQMSERLEKEIADVKENIEKQKSEINLLIEKQKSIII